MWHYTRNQRQLSTPERYICGNTYSSLKRIGWIVEKIGMTAFIVVAEDVFSSLFKASKDDWATTSSVR